MSKKEHLIAVIEVLKELAKNTAIKNKNNPVNSDYVNGMLLGYYSIINLFKHQAFVFCVDQKELGLADINPDIDLLGLNRNIDVDFGEGNWKTEILSEEKIQSYLIDLLTLLKDQAAATKKEFNDENSDFKKGELMAYFFLFYILKNWAVFFDLKEELLNEQEDLSECEKIELKWLADSIKKRMQDG